MANGNRNSRSSGRRTGGGTRSGGGGSRGGGARGGGARSGGRASGGGNNAMPMVIAVIAVIAVIGVFVAMSGSKKKKRDDYVSEELTSESIVDKSVPDKPAKPERPPPPNISPEIIAKAKEIVAWMDDELAEANKHYEAAMAAKEGGNEDDWQAKLHEAREHYLNIRERWNNEVVTEIEGELPTGCQWDADEVANFYVGKEAGKITKAIERLAYVSKQLRR